MAGEDVQRQEAIVIVVAVEESAFLLAVNGIVRGVEVENDLFGRRIVRGEELLDEDGVESNQRLAADAILQPTERRRRGPAGGRRRCRVR